MTLETLSSSEISNFLIYDTASPDSYYLHPSAFNFVVDGDDLCGGGVDVAGAGEDASERKKRRRRTKSSKNKEEAENQRMTHIAVERNRRRQMNEHLSVLRSLMPDSYVQRGDQASIVGGAIDFVKELEQLLQSLETQKRRPQQVTNKDSRRPTTADGRRSPPFSQFFTYPQYTWCQAPRENQTTEKHNQLHPATATSMADIEVTIIEKHTNLRILTHKRPGHLLKLVSGLEALHFAILHINATTMDPMALFSISAKVEEGCNLTTVDDIAAAVHRMLLQMEDEAPAPAPATN